MLKLHRLGAFIIFTILAVGGIYAQSPIQNFVVIFVDDLGYGDLGCYGHPTIETPNLDRMAQEGQKWTSFYVAANVCSPSRAALLTGRLPVRNGLYSNRNKGVFFPNSPTGLPPEELTIAEVLQPAGYATACIGKWHLGHNDGYLPTDQGFDYFYGLPYSNDMARPPGVGHREACFNPSIDKFNVPLLRNKEVIEQPVNQETITKRYTEEALRFIEDKREQPFFLYLAHTMPHVPLFASEAFRGQSKRGLYGDVVMELDWSVGQILDKLQALGLDQSTMVVFTSDNGPWLVLDRMGGTAGMLHGGKATSYEGGVRVPALFWAPSIMEPGTVTNMGSTLDLLPTIAELAGVELPSQRTLDGASLQPMLRNKSAAARDVFYYYEGPRVFALRKGPYKIHFYRNNPFGYPKRLEELDSPKLYNLEEDPSERFDLAAEHPELVAELTALRDAFVADVTLAESELDKTN
ncbi:MAG: sulfatase [Bacteroidota bacterium]